MAEFKAPAIWEDGPGGPGIKPSTITVAAQGANEKEALDQVTGGWFGDGNPPVDVVEGAKKAGLRLFRFRLQIECLGEIQAAEKCSKCLGCGQVADTEEQEPWSMWLELPLKSALAVTMGVVKPIPCPQCKGNKLAVVLDTIQRAGEVLKGGPSQDDIGDGSGTGD